MDSLAMFTLLYPLFSFSTPSHLYVSSTVQFPPLMILLLRCDAICMHLFQAWWLLFHPRFKINWWSQCLEDSCLASGWDANKAARQHPHPSIQRISFAFCRFTLRHCTTNPSLLSRKQWRTHVSLYQSRLMKNMHAYILYWPKSQKKENMVGEIKDVHKATG